MNKNLVILGTLAGIVGVTCCVLAALARIAGYYHVLGYPSESLFSVGTGLMVFACLLKLEELAARHRE